MTERSGLALPPRVIHATKCAPRASLFLVDADRTPPTANQGRLTVTLRMNLDPKQEFAQIFNEGWRLQRDYLYVPNLHGADWPRMKQMYGQLLPHVMHRADLNYLLDNMGAEIAIGHSYVRGGDMPAVPRPAGGLLGADLTVERGRYKITRIYDGESWNPELRAPLASNEPDPSTGQVTPSSLVYRMLVDMLQARVSVAGQHHARAASEFRQQARRFGERPLEPALLRRRPHLGVDARALLPSQISEFEQRVD